MLCVENIVTSYGKARALFGASLTIGSGEVVALMGRNGMGKTTLIRSVMGLTPPEQGRIRFRNQEITGLPPYRIARLGIGLVPEGREIFPTLTVRENLLAVAANPRAVDDPYTVERILAIFPRLAERIHHLGRDLSGGEQQMLAIGRALMINPALLLLDEATEGLAPLVCEEIWNGLSVLKKRGMSILVVDKNFRAILAIADQCCLMEKGRVAGRDERPFSAFTKEIRQQYLGI
jgi:branched-chain amino acid transport system ATP-binding protein